MKIPSPSGGQWAANTISGDSKRGTGILSNPRYRGEHIYGRQTNVKDLETGRVRKRLKPESEWKRTFVTEHAIIDDRSWSIAQEIKKQRRPLTASMLSKQRRPKEILSGKIKCGHCGKSFIKSGKDHIHCSSANKGMDCASNNWSIKLETVKSVVQATLLHDILSDEAVTAFCNELHQLTAGNRHISERTHLESAAEIERMAIKNLLSVAATGTDGTAPEVLMAEIQNRQSSLDAIQEEIETLSKRMKFSETLTDPKHISTSRDLITEEVQILMSGAPSSEQLALFNLLVKEITLTAPDHHNPRSRKGRKPGTFKITGGISAEALASVSSTYQAIMVPPPRFERGTSRSTI